MTRRSLLQALKFNAVLLCWHAATCGVAVAAEQDGATFKQTIQPILSRHCVECHQGDKPRGKLRLDLVGEDFSATEASERWQKIRKRVLAGDMPPEKRPRLTDAEIRALTEWVREGVQREAVKQRDQQGRVTLRRLNRAEYENTIRDLLGIVVDLQDLLPVDASADGFDNVASAMHVSSFLMDRYLEAADKALDLAIANGPQPPLFQKKYSLLEDRRLTQATEKVYRRREDGMVLFSSSPWNAVTMWEFYPPHRGQYRFRISSYGFQSADKPVTWRIDAGPMLMGTKNHLVGYFDSPADKPQIVEFVDHLEARSTIRILPFALASAQTVDKIGADSYTGPGLAIQYVEVEGPLHPVWPPESHRRIFGDLPRESPDKRNDREHVEVVSKDPPADARRILKDFCRRAWRRPAADDEITPLVALVETKLREGYSFEQAMRVGLKAVLVSSDFLFLRERPGKLDDFALASRLSYFLWSSMPDDELLTLAEQGKLTSDPAVRQAQIERMLNHGRAKQFITNFVGQWLKLRDIDFTEPDRLLYPEFDDLLKTGMVQEAQLFFEEVLKHDLSLTNFVASDFSMLNERLAKHYGIPGVSGWDFRKVMLPPDSHRGGVMTMAGVLKVTANGTSTSPVVRGAWVLDRILGTPPPNPPDGVPAVEPDIRGATTIRQQLAKHRENGACASCHRLIDPPGFALESFDVIGGWRENYRSLGRGEPVTIDGRRMHYARGPAVDPADTLADGRQFQNIDQLKQLLLENKDQLATALTGKLLTYATGRAPDETDAARVNAIVARIREKNYGLRTLLHEIVNSELFQRK